MINEIIQACTTAKAGVRFASDQMVRLRSTKDGSGSSPAGRAIKKPPFDQICWPMAGIHVTAVIAETGFERPFRPSSCQSPFDTLKNYGAQKAAHVPMRGGPWPISPYLSVLAGRRSGSRVAVPVS